jgi:hypothetical protein
MNQPETYPIVPKKKFKIDKESITAVDVEKYNNELANNHRLQEFLTYLTTMNSNTHQTSKRKIHNISIEIKQIWKEAAKKHLKAKTVKILPFDITNTASFKDKKQTSKDAIYVNKLITKRQRHGTITQEEIAKIITIHEQYDSVMNPKYKPLVGIPGLYKTIEELQTKLAITLHQLKGTIKRYSKYQENKHKYESLRRIDKTFNDAQRKHIAKMLDKERITWEGLTFVKDINNPLGIITEPNQIKKSVNDFYKKLFDTNNNKPAIDLDNSPWNNKLQPLSWINAQDMQDLADPITSTEVYNTLRTLKNKKTPGPDNMPYELYKLLNKDNPMINLLTQYFNYWMKYTIVPKDANKGTIICLPKTKEYTGDLGKIRPITLLQTERKIVTAIINRRLQIKNEELNLLRGNNFGFMTGKSTNNNVTIIKSIIDQAKVHNKELYIASLDIQKAYDSVPWEAIEVTLRRIKVPQRLIKLFKILCLDPSRKLTIDTPYGPTEWFSPRTSVPQGDKSSCILWNIFYDPVLVEMENSTHG